MRRAQGARARRLHEVPRRRPAALHRWHSKRPAASCLPAPSCCQAQVQATAAARHKCRHTLQPGTARCHHRTARGAAAVFGALNLDTDGVAAVGMVGAAAARAIAFAGLWVTPRQPPLEEHCPAGPSICSQLNPRPTPARRAARWVRSPRGRVCANTRQQKLSHVRVRVWVPAAGVQLRGHILPQLCAPVHGTARPQAASAARSARCANQSRSNPQNGAPTVGRRPRQALAPPSSCRPPCTMPGPPAWELHPQTHTPPRLVQWRHAPVCCAAAHAPSVPHQHATSA